MAGYQRGGSRTREEPHGNGQQDQAKNPPIFSRRIYAPGGTIEMAVFEKQVGEKRSFTTFFVSVHRSYPDPENKGKPENQWKYIETTVMNPQDLLIVADLYKIAWDFILEEVNRE